MAKTYIFPVVDRALLDVTNKTKKGYFNTFDFVRINSNGDFVASLIQVFKNYPYPYNDEDYGFAYPAINPEITDFPVYNTQQMPYDLVAFIEQIRYFLGAPVSVIPILVPNNYRYKINYIDVNLWESALDLILQTTISIMGHSVQCGVSNVGQQRFYQSRWRTPFARSISSPYRVFRSGISTTGSSLVRGNSFRRYS